MSMDVDKHGPLFDGRAPFIITEGCREVDDRIAKIGKDLVVNELKRVIRNPTPHYWNQIDIMKADAGVMISDGGVVYGPWLEGTGSRNRTTRFKGYWTFRRMSVVLERASQAIADLALKPTVNRLN